MSFKADGQPSRSAPRRLPDPGTCPRCRPVRPLASETGEDDLHVVRADDEDIVAAITVVMAYTRSIPCGRQFDVSPSILLVFLLYQKGRDSRIFSRPPCMRLCAAHPAQPSTL